MSSVFRIGYQQVSLSLNQVLGLYKTNDSMPKPIGILKKLDFHDLFLMIGGGGGGGKLVT